MKKPLVQTETAVKFINQMKLDVHRRVNLGDPTKHKAVLNYVTAAHTAIIQGVETVEALSGDRTRSEPEQHDAGRKVAARTIEKLQQCQSSIRVVANNMAKAATEAIEEQFAPNPNRARIESEIVSWIQERALAGDIPAIRKQMLETPEVASVLYHTPPFLLRLASDAHQSLTDDIIEKGAPQHYAAIEESIELNKLADKYSNVAAGVKTSFYNAAIAEQVKTRVEV